MKKINIKNKKNKLIVTLGLIGFGLITPIIITSCSNSQSSNNVPTYYSTKEELARAFYYDLKEWCLNHSLFTQPHVYCTPL